MRNELLRERWRWRVGPCLVTDRSIRLCNAQNNARCFLLFHSQRVLIFSQEVRIGSDLASLMLSSFQTFSEFLTQLI